jgi:hypothetical protein
MVAFRCYVFPREKGEVVMDSTFGNWRSAAVGVGLTVVVLGTGLALAFL